MLFTRIPQQYAPLGGELRYAVSQETAGNIDIRIVDAAAGSAAGIGAAVSPGACEAAPFVCRRLHFTPASGRTGFYPAEGRIVTAVG